MDPTLQRPRRDRADGMELARRRSPARGVAMSRIGLDQCRNQSSRRRGWKYLAVLWLLYVLIATVLFFRVTAVQQTNDSPSYLRAASAPLSSHTLWLGDKPPLVPLICKTLSNNLGAIVKFQFVFSVFAWSCLAYTLAAFVNRTLTRSALFAGILILSLGSDVSMWTHTIMSESVDHSCLALLLASWLLLMNRPSARRCIVVALLSGIWALTRDSNATVLIMVSITTGAARRAER